jgi:hypothetical protein
MHPRQAAASRQRGRQRDGWRDSFVTRRPSRSDEGVSAGGTPKQKHRDRASLAALSHSASHFASPLDNPRSGYARRRSWICFGALHKNHPGTGARRRRSRVCLILRLQARPGSFRSRDRPPSIAPGRSTTLPRAQVQSRGPCPFSSPHWAERRHPLSCVQARAAPCWLSDSRPRYARTIARHVFSSAVPAQLSSIAPQEIFA